MIDERGRRFEYGRWYPSHEARDALRPLSVLFASITERLDEMADDDLELLIAALDDFREDNCWWAELGVIRAFQRKIRNEPARRQHQAGVLDQEQGEL